MTPTKCPRIRLAYYIIESKPEQEIELPFDFSKVTDLTPEFSHIDKQVHFQLLIELTQNASELKKKKCFENL